jgi:hypothetical protein
LTINKSLNNIYNLKDDNEHDIENKPENEGFIRIAKLSKTPENPEPTFYDATLFKVPFYVQ